MLHCTKTRMPVPMPGRPTRDLPPPLPGEYPANLEGVFENAQEQLIIRPIRPSDEAAHANFFAHQTPDDIRFRFFSALKQIPPKLMFRLTHIDYVTEMAFIAVRPATGETLGVARLVRDGLSEDGEFAVAIRPDVKSHGLAYHLMQRLFDWGRSQDMTHVHALILSDNGPMIAFVRKLGCRLRRDPQDSTVVIAEMSL